MGVMDAFIWGAGGQRMTPEQVARQRQVAEALAARGGDTSPVGHWTAGAARVADALGGVLKERRADKAEKSNQDRDSSLMRGLLGNLGGGATGVTAPAAAAAPSEGKAKVASALMARAKNTTGGPDERRNNSIPESYFSSIRSAESGGNDRAKNPLSSASGRYQFTTGTWNDLARKQPELGLTPDGRFNPEQQERAIRAFTKGNADILSGKGIPLSGGSLYAAHFLGAGDAPRVYGAADETPVSALLSPAVIKANPFLQGMTAGKFKQWAERKGGGGEMMASAGAPSPTMGYAPPAPSGGAMDAVNAMAAGGQAPQMPPQQTMPQAAPMSTAGMNFDPATGQVGRGVSLNAGATAMPAQAPASGSNPFAGIVSALMGRQQPGQQQAAPQQAMPDPPPMAGALAQQSGMGGLPPGLADALSDPAASESTKRVAMALLQREMAKNEASAPAGPDYQFVTMPDGTLVRADKTSGDIAPMGQFARQQERQQEAPTVRQIKQADGSEVAVQWDPEQGKWAPMQAPQGGAAVASMPKLTEGQSKDVGFYDRGMKANTVLDQTENSLLSKIDAGAAMMPGGNMVVSEDYQKADQAAREVLAVILRKDTGAAVTPSEMDQYGKIYLPRVGDGPETVAQKRIARATALNGIRNGLGSVGDRMFPRDDTPAPPTVLEPVAEPSAVDLADPRTAPPIPAPTAETVTDARAGLLEKARKAIELGADPEMVKKRLREAGIDAGGL